MLSINKFIKKELGLMVAWGWGICGVGSDE
jgi:hypothetical protein